MKALIGVALFLGFAYLGSTVSACTGCGGTNGSGSGSVSGGYPSFDYTGYKYEVEFPSCLNPRGTVVADYPEGNKHWILGESTLRIGSDKVYNIENGNHLQCYCPNGGKDMFNNVNNGVQTNWLKASNLSKEQQGWLLANGWKYVSNGADFGLSPETYLGKNLPYACGTKSCIGPTTKPPQLPAGRTMNPLAVYKP